jgi:hypothetical protein
VPQILKSFFLDALLRGWSQAFEERFVRVQASTQDSTYNRGKELGQQLHDLGSTENSFYICKSGGHKGIVLDYKTSKASGSEQITEG